MITVKLMGGLGNQMFQYAAAWALARRHDTSLVLDLSFLLDKTPRPEFILRDFDLDIFNLPSGIERLNALPEKLAGKNKALTFHPKLMQLISRSAQKSQLLKYIISNILQRLSYFSYTEPFFEFNPLFFHLPANSYISGYFQSFLYFKGVENQIRQQFSLEPNLSEASKRLAQEIINSDSVCINVRRTDYINHKVTNETHGFCDLNYFDKCISIMHEKQTKPKFFIFSDDVEWCTDNFSNRPGFTIVDHSHKGPKFSWYLHLMSLCRHFIIPNSSFAWWAAWLSRSNGVVLAPQNWFRDSGVNTGDLFPPHWHLIEN